MSPERLFDILYIINDDLKCKKIYFYQFGTHGGKLAIIISKEICEDINEKISDNVFANFEKLQGFNKVAKWINSYLHNLRILGNESVLVMERECRIPEKLTQSDLFVFMTNMIRVIEFYFTWKGNL